MTPSSAKSKTILVVEDDFSIRESLKIALELEGYKVITAENGKIALELIKQEPKPCLVLLDMMMPMMSGREFLDQVLADSVLAPIPVFVVSAVADQQKSEGAIGFMKKPADLDLLLKFVAQHTSRLA